MLLMERRFKVYAKTGVWPKRIPVKKIIDVKLLNDYESLTVFKTNNGWTTRVLSFEHPDFDQLVEDEDDGSLPDWI